MVIQFNIPESSASINFDDVCEILPPQGGSAIDEFYAVRDKILSVAFSAPFDSDKELRNLLILNLCSAAETYFRRVIASVLSICPLAKEQAATQMVSLGAVSSYGLKELGIGIGDTKGFTSVGEISSRTNNILAIQIKPGTSLGVAVEEFEQVCNLRHAMVHSSGEILFSNRKLLQVTRRGRLRIDLNNDSFQTVLQKVVNVVRSYNNNVADEVMTRWFIRGIMTRRWPRDRAKFEALFRIFYSRRDLHTSRRAFDAYRTYRVRLAKPGH